MADGSMLFLEEWEVLVEQNAPLVRVIQAGERVFALAVDLIRRVLGEEDGVAAAKGREDFADVVERLAEGIGAAHRQLLEQVVGAELHLGTLVVGEARVAAKADDAEIAVDAANWIVAKRAGIAGACKQCRGRGTWSQSSGD